MSNCRRVKLRAKSRVTQVCAASMDFVSILLRSNWINLMKMAMNSHLLRWSRKILPLRQRSDLIERSQKRSVRLKVSSMPSNRLFARSRAFSEARKILCQVVLEVQINSRSIKTLAMQSKTFLATFQIKFLAKNLLWQRSRSNFRTWTKQ